MASGARAMEAQTIFRPIGAYPSRRGSESEEVGPRRRPRNRRARERVIRAGLRPARLPFPAVLEAVLFDWGDTLMEFVYDPALVEAGHRAGLAALRRDGLPAV